MAEKAYQLIVEYGPDIGKIFPLQREKLIIGRDPVADIILVDPEISRQHARLVRGETSYHIEDLNSTNGTVVNGQRLRDELVPLQDGTEIMLGSDVMLRYRVSPAGEGEERPPTSHPTSSPSAQQPLSPLPPEPAEEEPEPVSVPTQPSQEIEAAFPPPTMVSDEELDTLDKSTVSEPDPPPLPEPERPKSHPLVAQGNGRRRRRNTTVIAIVVVIFLCLCAVALSAYFWWGDLLMNALGVY